MANELILIVEDNPKNLKLVRDTLQVKGYRTIEAGTGEQGVQLARDQHPALILMDIHLAGITGEEAFHQLRADPGTRAIPVIAVTASVMAHDRKRIMLASTAFRASRSACGSYCRLSDKSSTNHQPDRARGSSSPDRRSRQTPTVGREGGRVGG